MVGVIKGWEPIAPEQIVGYIEATIYWFTDLITQRRCDFFNTCFHSGFFDCPFHIATEFGFSLCSLLGNPYWIPPRGSSFLRFSRWLRLHLPNNDIAPVSTCSGFSICVAVVPLWGSLPLWWHHLLDGIAPTCTRLMLLFVIAVIPFGRSSSLWRHCSSDASRRLPLVLNFCLPPRS